ncbi:hypothetical protein ACNQFZ_12735 [Schinkia sp. CFF1]
MKKYLLITLLCILAISGCSTQERNVKHEKGMEDFVLGNELNPGHIHVKDYYNNVKVNTKGEPVFVVGITPFGDGFILCDYENIYLLDGNNLIRLSPPKNINVWNPTGVFYSEITSSLFVANYNGHNVVELDVNLKKKQLDIRKVLKAPEMVSPENVAVSEDGSHIAIADYDGNKVFLFNSNGEIEWSTDVKQAHGIAIDESNVYATSLTDRKLVKIDLKGTITKEVGGIGWNENEYLWPTAISSTKNYLLITDAHTGKLTFLTKDLEYVGAIGGNGPGIDAFNYPYTAIFKSGNILLTDSFKARILEIDANANIVKQYNLGPFELKVKNAPLLKGDQHNPYTFHNNVFTQIPVEFMNPYYNHSLKLASGFNSIDVVTNNGELVSQMEIDYPESPSYIGKNYWYVTWLKNITFNNNRYYVVGSPQHRTFIIYDVTNNIFSIKTLTNGLYDLWVFNDQVYLGSDKGFQLESVIEDQIPLFNKFNKEVKSGISRLDAYNHVFYPEMSKDQFMIWLKKMIPTTVGEQWLEKVGNDVDANAAARQYFFDIKDEPYKYLLETLLIKSFGNFQEDLIDLTESATVTKEKEPYENYGIKGSLDDDPNTYTGYKEGMNPGIFELEWAHEVKVTDILIEWLSENDKGLNYKIVGIDKDGQEQELFSEKNNQNVIEHIRMGQSKTIKKLRFEFNSGTGQNRLLMRDFKVFGSNHD